MKKTKDIKARKSKPIIQIEDVSRDFIVGKKTVPALFEVNLDIFKGDFIIIFGPSGCGKSTLLNILTGIDKPTVGAVHLGGHDFSEMKNRKRAIIRSKNFGIIYQMPWWVKSLNVLENVALPLYIREYSQQEAQTVALTQLEQFKIQDLQNQMPTQLSGGQQQQVEFARALVTNPAIIVADEPTGNLDSTSADVIMGYFDYLNKELKKTIILVTHNTAYWELGNKRAEMKDGKIIKVSDYEK